MTDLTLLYYTANTIENKYKPGHVAEHVRQNLVDLTDGAYPIVSVSQKPINFGTNICVGDIGKSLYNCYKQILIGAKAAKTKYVACCEDDVIYNPEHFTHRPTDDNVFAYNANMWYAEDTFFWKKGKLDYGMLGCICNRKLLIKTLEPRYELYPEEPLPRTNINQRFWEEPGRFDDRFGVKNVKVETFQTKEPILVLNYCGSLCGKRGYGSSHPTMLASLAPFGKATPFWNKIWK